MDFGTSHLLNFSYQKSVDEVKSACQDKLIKLSAKIKERGERVKALRDLHGIDDSALIQLLTAARRAQNANHYTFTASIAMSTNYGSKGTNQTEMVEKTVGAGVVQNLLTEQDAIEQETDSMRKLNLIIRNLRPYRAWNAPTGEFYSDDQVKLTVDELSFLGL